MNTCPHCGSSQQGAPIPEDYRREGDGDRTHCSRTIGHVVQGVYDGVLFWSCPDCKGRWHRFPEGDYLRGRAEPYVHPGVAE